jgi:CRISPR system Cascade subunit CasC
MSLFIEFHLIQNFAPSNLNRDDTGAPKDALFGGYRRARVSSQCLKRSAREWFKSSNLIDSENLATRTRHLDRLLEEELRAIGLKDTSVFNEIVKLSIKKKKGKDNSGSSQDKDGEQEEKLLSYLLFISATEVNAYKELIRQHADKLISLAGKKKIKATDIGDGLKADIQQCLRTSKAVDVALFGRMLADLPEVNQYAACQVAHAISTHRVDREFDYFTAVDDMGSPDETGAGMIGQIEFNSATFYRYAVIDAHKLLANLQQDKALTLAAIEAFAQAVARAIPTGKQNTFAAHNLPGFVGVTLRHGSPLNLANAFEKPVAARQDKALTSISVEAMATHEVALAGAYADDRDTWGYLDLTGAWPKDKGTAFSNMNDLAGWVKQQAEKYLEN